MRGLRRGSAAAHLLGWGFESPHEYLSLVISVCSLVEISASGSSLVQRSPTDCGVFECDLENSTMRRSRSTGTVEPWKKKKNYSLNYPSVSVYLRWLPSYSFCSLKSLPFLLRIKQLCLSSLFSFFLYFFLFLLFCNFRHISLHSTQKYAPTLHYAVP